jgi:hypothetical protein
MAMNLNGDEYEGSELIFPEYGPDRCKPDYVVAMIFSCSLLHEALPGTKGVSLAHLTFLRAPSKPVGPAGANTRQKNHGLSALLLATSYISPLRSKFSPAMHNTASVILRNNA